MNVKLPSVEMLKWAEGNEKTRFSRILHAAKTLLTTTIEKLSIAVSKNDQEGDKRALNFYRKRTLVKRKWTKTRSLKNKQSFIKEYSITRFYIERNKF